MRLHSVRSSLAFFSMVFATSTGREKYPRKVSQSSSAMRWIWKLSYLVLSLGVTNEQKPDS